MAIKNTINQVEKLLFSSSNWSVYKSTYCKGRFNKRNMVVILEKINYVHILS